MADFRSCPGCTPLHWAVYNGHCGVADILLTRGAKVQAEDSRGYALSSGWSHGIGSWKNWTIFCGQFLVGELFHFHFQDLYFSNISRLKPLKSGAMVVWIWIDLDAWSLRGATPLHKAAARGHRSVAELLLAEGASINSTDGRGQYLRMRFMALIFFGKKHRNERIP